MLADSGVSVLVSLSQFGREDYAAMLFGLAPEVAAGKPSSHFPALRTVLLLDGGGVFGDDAQARDAAEPLTTAAPGDDASATDDAMVLYTSGSTSRPKAIALKHYLIVENSFNIGERQGLGPGNEVPLSPSLF